MHHQSIPTLLERKPRLPHSNKDQRGQQEEQQPQNCDDQRESRGRAEVATVGSGPTTKALTTLAHLRTKPTMVAAEHRLQFSSRFVQHLHFVAAQRVLAVISLPAVVTLSALLRLDAATAMLARLAAPRAAGPVVDLQLKPLLAFTFVRCLDAVP